jgi:hypothetical protein
VHALRAARDLALCLCLALAGCPSAAFDEHGPRELAGSPTSGEARAARAYARPTLAVTPAGAFEEASLRVEVQRLSQEGSALVATLVPLSADAPEAATMTLRLDLGARVALPLAEGERYWLRTSARRGGAGLLVWDTADTPRLVMALSIGDGLDDDAVAGMSVGLDESRLLFTEVKTLPSGCITALDHHALAARSTRGGSISAEPG